MSENELLMPELAVVVSVVCPKTENFCAWHFKNCVDILRSEWVAEPYPENGKYLAVTNDPGMFSVIKKEMEYISWHPFKGNHFYGCRVFWAPNHKLDVGVAPNFTFSGVIKSYPPIYVEGI